MQTYQKTGPNPEIPADKIKPLSAAALTENGARAAQAASLTRLSLGPIPITKIHFQEALELTGTLIRGRQHHYFCFCEANLLSSVLRDATLANRLREADAVFADGVALVALARLLGHPLPERISGPSFLLAACAYGVERGWRHFFYGGAPGVAETLANRLRQDYPNLIIAGTHCPPFRPLTNAEESETRQLIESAAPDLLWVSLGSPKQELWCAEHLGRIDVPLMLPVGAAFDFHSGQRPWAPKWIRRIGMEWAFRMLTGGKKTFQRNVRCVSVVGAYLAKVAVFRAIKRNPTA